MEAYNAWAILPEGRDMHRIRKPSLHITKCSYPTMVTLSFEALCDLSADDWEVVRDKHKVELCDTEFSGMFGSKSITEIVYNETGKSKPPRFTKVTFEWEE